MYIIDYGLQSKIKKSNIKIVMLISCFSNSETNAVNKNRCGEFSPQTFLQNVCFKIFPLFEIYFEAPCNTGPLECLS